MSIPEEIADEYSLFGLFVYAGNEWLAVYPLQDEMIYDPMSRSYIGYFLSIWEPESEGVQNLLLEAVFVSSQPNTPFVLAADFRIVSICVPSILSCPSPTCSCGPRPPYVEGWDPICFIKQAPCDGNCFGYCFDEMGCRFKGGPCDGECWGYCFGEPTGPIPPDSGTSPPNDGGTPPSDDGGSDDSGTESPNGDCKGISYYLPIPIILGRIVQPSEKEIVVSAGDTLILRADGLPNPDKDKKVSRSYNSKTQSCSSSEIEIAGPNLSFIWRLWKESSGLNLVGVIGYGQQIQWQAPSEVGTYWIELIVDDDLYPDYDAPGEIVKCEKCSETSNADDPAARDWVKVKIVSKGGVDLDCDSDNDGRLEEDYEEETKEDIPPGCFVDLGTTKELVVKTKVKGDAHKVRLSWEGDSQVTVYDENGAPIQSPLEWTVPSGSSRRTFKIKGEGIGRVRFISSLLDPQGNILDTDKVVFTVPWEIVLIEEQTENFVKMLPEVYVSSPHPTIQLHQCQITAENLPNGGNMVKLQLQGTIRSRACDLVPGNLGTITSFALYTNDDSSDPVIISIASDWDGNGVADMQVQKLSTGSLTRPYPFEAHFKCKFPSEALMKAPITSTLKFMIR